MWIIDKLQSLGRRPPCDDVAPSGTTNGTRKRDNGNPRYIKDKCYYSSSSSCKCQWKKLAQHTVIRRNVRLTDMAVAMVSDTLCTLCVGRVVALVNVKRRKDQHWHIDCQQHPRGNMSFHLQIHGCKVTIKRAKNQIFIWFFRARVTKSP